MTFSLDPFCHGNPISFFLFLFLAIIVLAIKIYDIRMKSRFFEAGRFQFSQCRRFEKSWGKITDITVFDWWSEQLGFRFELPENSKKTPSIREIGILCAVKLPQYWQSNRPRGGGGLLNKFLYGEAPPRGPTRYPFIYYFSRKRYSFRITIPSIDKWYPFHIPHLELCIPLSFNCCKCIVI